MVWASIYDGSLPRFSRGSEPEETFGESVSMMLGGSLVTVVSWTPTGSNSRNIPLKYHEKTPEVEQT